ncbi:hypothetical protein OUZ56_021493 [Daphnia magna]|uniref:Uncharacterized protein n=1 Tax=Daphnia magna TaxID=35525 RepID=A0ABQ9ZHK9_9CRUS|nr:hypothetical protein OUZ56_021493 [Daphnia magna]
MVSAVTPSVTFKVCSIRSSNGPKIVLDGDLGLGLGRLNQILVVRGIQVNQTAFAYLDDVPMSVAWRHGDRSVEHLQLANEAQIRNFSSRVSLLFLQSRWDLQM